MVQGFFHKDGIKLQVGQTLAIGMAVGVGEGIAERCVELGYDYIVGGVDVGFLVGASKTASAGLRKLFEAPLAGPDEKKSFY